MFQFGPTSILFLLYMFYFLNHLICDRRLGGEIHELINKRGKHPITVLLLQTLPNEVSQNVVSSNEFRPKNNFVQKTVAPPPKNKLRKQCYHHLE